VYRRREQLATFLTGVVTVLFWRNEGLGWPGILRAYTVSNNVMFLTNAYFSTPTW